jgi:flavodoxin
MSKASVLVVYYSRSGATATVAGALATALHADLEAIVEHRDRSGVAGFLRSIVDAVTRRGTEIEPAKRDVSAYELVVIGGPVWAGSVSAPVRAWLAANKAKLRRAAFFCTYGGHGSDTVFRQMRELTGRQPLARCAVRAGRLRLAGHNSLLDAFIERIERRLMQIDEPEWMV